MRNFTSILLLLLTSSISVVGQQKLTLEEIWGGAFRTKGMDELNAMKNTNQYTVLNFDRNSKTMQIDLFDYATLHKVATLIDTKDFGIGAQILHDLDISKIRLVTNTSLSKRVGMIGYGLEIVEHVNY